MKVLLVNGSPHVNGNTATALEEMIKVFAAEGIETGAEEYELNLVDMAKKYNMELDKLKELISDAEAENMKKDMAMGKTVDMLVNKAKIKKPEKPAKEEKTEKADK